MFLKRTTFTDSKPECLQKYNELKTKLNESEIKYNRIETVYPETNTKEYQKTKHILKIVCLVMEKTTS